MGLPLDWSKDVDGVFSNAPDCGVMHFCLLSFCSCWKFVLSLIYASVGYRWAFCYVECSFSLGGYFGYVAAIFL